MTLQTELAQRFTDGLGDWDLARLGLAVSGGGDSIALLRLAVSWARANSVSLFVYTVNHGLRPEAASEVAFVADLCEALDVPHRSLVWTGWDGSGNLSQDARNARYRLIAEAAIRDQVPVIALGHTQDDQAETVLMALSRRSGVDGLAGMAPWRTAQGVTWARPLLGTTRAELRAYLGHIGQTWIDDPTNEDTRFERVRMRNAKASLEALGLTADALADVAQHMQSVQITLRDVTRDAWQGICTPTGGAICMDREKFQSQPAEIRRRLMVDALRFVAPSAGAPRKDAVASLLDTPQNASLAGCLVLFKPRAVWITREPNAVKGVECPIEDVWDGKWRVSGEKAGHDLVIRALGENGLKSFPDWRELALPRQVLLTSPAIWQGARLIDAPLLSESSEWSAELLFGKEVFHS